MNLRLGEPVRELQISHGYYSAARMRERLEGQPIHQGVTRPAPHAWDWRTGMRSLEAELRADFDADVPAQGGRQ